MENKKASHWRNSSEKEITEKEIYFCELESEYFARFLKYFLFFTVHLALLYLVFELQNKRSLTNWKARLQCHTT